jgi:zinc transport system substrate-binding protein
MRIMVLGLLLSVGLLVSLCFPSTVLAKPNLVIGVSILPQKYFVERIAGPDAKIVVMVGPGHNPSTYEPKPRQLSQLNDAALYFLAGVPFEKKWRHLFEQINPSMKVVYLTEGIKLRKYQILHTSSNGHRGAPDKDEADEHGILDPHFWLNPQLVKRAASTIKDALVAISPKKRRFYQANYEDFVNDLEQLDQNIRHKISVLNNKSFFVFHSSWGYFADAYGLTQIAIESQGRQLGAKALNMVLNKIKKSEVKVIFIQKQFSDRSAAAIARQVDARLVHVDPLAEKYFENMRLSSDLFVDALR